MKITLNEFIEQSAHFIGRKLTEREVESIQPCNCGQDFCSGWTAEFEVPAAIWAHKRVEL